MAEIEVLLKDYKEIIVAVIALLTWLLKCLYLFMAKKKKKREKPLKVHGTFEQVIAASVSGNPKPKKSEKK